MTSLYVQVPAFEEPETLPPTLRSISDQHLPRGVSVTQQVWVTRSEDGAGCCSTWQAAESVSGWEVREAPAGKLSARNAAHAHAFESGADLICSWDADAPPLHEKVLYSLTQSALSDGVAIANSTPVARDGSLIGVVSDVASRAEDQIMPHVHGQCHVMTAETWRRVGPFETNLDETSLGAVRAVEEFGFYEAASEVGRVEKVQNAKVFNNPRRNVCRLPGYGRGDDFCERRGGSTF